MNGVKIQYSAGQRSPEMRCRAKENSKYIAGYLDACFERETKK